MSDVGVISDTAVGTPPVKAGGAKPEAHAKREERIGQADPDCYARYVAPERAGEELPT